MSVVDLYIDYFSQPSRAVLSFCIEAQIPYKIIEIRLAKGSNLKEDYLKISPYGTVPAIVHNTHKIYESHAIMCYLADVFNKNDPWYPKPPEKRVYIEIYLYWHNQNIRTCFGNYIYNKYIGPKFFQTKYSQDINDFCEFGQSQSLEFLDYNLKNKFVAGTDQPTIADLSLYCELSQMFMINHDFSYYKNLTK